MRRVVWLWASALALAVAIAGTASAPAARKPPAYSSSTILVKFRGAGVARATVARLGDRVAGTTLTGVTLVGLGRKDDVARKVAQYKALPVVAYAEPNFIARLNIAAPNDPLFGQQWGFAKIQALDGWSISPATYSAQNRVALATVDTGIDALHTEFSDGRIVSSASCVNATDTCVAGPAQDDNGHGTHVAGIAAAATNNANGVAGTAFDASIIPVKVADAGGAATYAAMANGIVWGSQHGARVANVSIGGSAFSQTLCDAVTTAINAGTLVVASAGNNASAAANYPAACTGAVGVAATDANDAPAAFSNFGKPNVFVAAPGVLIYSTYKGGIYQNMSGTSMSAPFVTGLAALLFAQSPARTVADVKTLLATTSDKVGSGYGADPYAICTGCTWSTAAGYGRINAYRALSAGAMDFSLAASPAALSAGVASSASTTVTVTATSGFSDAVDLSVSGLPIGATASFSPATVAGSGTSQLTVTVVAATPGAYTLTVTGKSGWRSHATQVALTVSPSVGPLPPAPPLPVPLPPLPPLPALPPS
jgi:thermitase